MREFISEAIVPESGTFEIKAMSRGEPGLPSGFNWRGVAYTVTDLIESFKRSAHEGHHADGELYLRRHEFVLQMSDGSTWTVYFTRQSRGSSQRWFLYSIERPD